MSHRFYDEFPNLREHLSAQQEGKYRRKSRQLPELKSASDCNGCKNLMNASTFSLKVVLNSRVSDSRTNERSFSNCSGLKPDSTILLSGMVMLVDATEGLTTCVDSVVSELSTADRDRELRDWRLFAKADKLLLLPAEDLTVDFILNMFKLELIDTLSSS